MDESGPAGVRAGDVDLYRYVVNSAPNFADPDGDDIYLVPGDPFPGGYRHITVIVWDPGRNRYKAYNGCGPGGSPGTHNDSGPSPQSGGSAPVATQGPLTDGPFPTYGMPPILVEEGDFNHQVVSLNWAFRRTKQIPQYCTLGGPNSNTWARRFLKNGGYNPPTPPNRVATGWDNGAYGGTVTVTNADGSVTIYYYNIFGELTGTQTVYFTGVP